MNPKSITGSRKVIIPIIILALTTIAIIALATDQPTLTFTPTEATSGQALTITVTNGAFEPYTNVSIYFNGTYITSVSANATGGVYAIIQVPYSLPAGEYNITAEGTNSSGQPTTAIPTQLFNETFSLNPPGFGSPGSTVYFTGFGFQSGETVKVYFDGVVVATVTANSTGYISGSFTVPSTASVGQHTVVAVGQTSGVTYVSSFYVTVAKITLSTTTATVGTSVIVSGSGGFPANQYVVLCFNNTVVNTAYTSSSGTFMTNFTVPQMPNGTYPVIAMASLNAVPIGSECPFIGETYEGGYASSSLTVVPSLVVNVTQTCPGFEISVVGYGFWPGTNVTVYLNGTFVGSSLISNNGTFEEPVTFSAPTTPGTYVITVNETFKGYPTPPVTITVLPPTIYINGGSAATQIPGGGS